MGLKEDLNSEINQILRNQWTDEKTSSIPKPEDIRLSNHAKILETATVLYADIDGSTNMVDSYPDCFCAEVYKTYLLCAARIIKAEDGEITAYDGDRIMGIFIGNSKNTDAVRTALKINYAVVNMLRPAFKEKYPDRPFILQHTIGIDTSKLYAARTGVRGDNDIVWVGRAANYAAKLTSCSKKPLWITESVYKSMNDDVKYSNSNSMWEKFFWTTMNKQTIYGSSYHWGEL